VKITLLLSPIGENHFVTFTDPWS